MISSVSILTRGRVNAKQAVVFAAIGWVLVFNPIPNNLDSGDGFYAKKNKLELVDKQKKIKLDDDEIINIIKMFMQCL
jgi:hypothetical protein